MKILHIIPTLRKGGAERLAITICQELQKRSGVEVRLLTFSNENEYQNLTNSIRWDVVPAYYIPSIIKKSKKNIAQLQAYIDDFCPDVIHSHLWEAEIVSRQIKCKNAMWYSHLHDNIIELHKPYFPNSSKKLFNLFERILMIRKYKKIKNNFIAISEDSYQYAIKNLPKTLSQRVFKLHNAIDTQRFEKLYSEIKPSSQIKLLTVGSLFDKKNQIYLIPIVAKLKELGFDVELTILGVGPNLHKIKHKIKELGLETQVHLLGNVDVEEYYWNASIYVHSATYEPFGLVFIEAMAAGLPIVCLDGKGNRDIIQNNVNGYILQEEEQDLFVEKIIQLYTNSDLFKQIQQNCLEFAKKFDIDQYVNILYTKYLNTKYQLPTQNRLISKLNRNLQDSFFYFGIESLVIPKKFSSRIIMYHGIDSNQNKDYNFRFIGAKQFEKQMYYLKKYCNVISLNDYFAQNFDKSKCNIAITFDDGYANNYEIALPILEKYQLPATIFVTGLNEIEKNILWADFLDIASTLCNAPLIIDDEEYIKGKNGVYYLKNSNVTLKSIIKTRGLWELKMKMIDAFLQHIPDFRKDSKYDEYWKLLTNEQIAKLSKSALIDIGSHSMYHNNLGNIPKEAAKSEIAESKRYLERIIQKEVTSFSYPDGSYNDELITFAQEIGFKQQVAVTYNNKMKNERIIDRYGMYPIYSVYNQIIDVLK